MKITRLRITGFKSFVEPVEIPIEPGLTGIVGPNGCGKSNLVEALRWVMGESSHKNMRASGMEDVIFSGSGTRPGRDTAEVLVRIDNSDRTAPAAVNDSEALEVSRRIERDAGSIYRINGREVRARDVQLLFADAATGARSPALVRQGQIAEIIAAKPQARRRILEDAAGIAGLHARRHEAELRLKAADDNLVRVEDVLREIEAQIAALARQSRQATRYRAVSADIRRLEAQAAAIGYAEAQAELAIAESRAAEDLAAVAERQRQQTAAATAQAVAAHALPALRDTSAETAAAAQRLAHALADLDAQERRARERAAELERQEAELARDLAREAASGQDAVATVARLESERDEIAAEDAAAEAARRERQTAVAHAEAEAGEAESALAATQRQAADLAARRSAFERALRDECDRAAGAEAERMRVERDLAALAQASLGGGPPIDELRAEVFRAEELVRRAEDAAAATRAAALGAREAESAARAPLAEAERRAGRLETEARTLAKVFAPATGDFWPRVLDQVTAAKGYEVALAAALGDDLEASTSASAPTHWTPTANGEADPALPAGVEPLSGFAAAPPALLRRLRQIGVVSRAQGAALRLALLPGQRLVSREGDLWRWDGFTAAAEAPSPAARRLAERNRLGELERDATRARGEVRGLQEAAEERRTAARDAAAAETAALEGVREARRRLDAVRQELAAADRREADLATRRAGLEATLDRARLAEADARSRVAAAEAALAGLAPAPDLDARLAEARLRAAAGRNTASDARAALQGLIREAEMRRRRSEAIAADLARWTERGARAEAASAELNRRLERTRTERAQALPAPEDHLLRRRGLLAEIEAAEAARNAAADRLARAEAELSEADRLARAALDALTAAREARARSQARQDALSERIAAIARGILDGFETTPAGLMELAGLKPGAALPQAAEVEIRLGTARAERERLGAVNLRADEELAEIEAKREGLAAERDDLAEAIKRLRQAIANLNREGRDRLSDAFERVNGHFGTLFTTLFDGGSAELMLVDSEDPLEAGLDIAARPPGKKPQSMSLLSGGEQALTATALIFAVFLTNPSPICVLDEVDAPLDDANVERYCDLLVGMAAKTDTRFVVITHNPITMARMNRLFGVTMAERGVSQLVSVDLEDAERMLEAV